MSTDPRFAEPTPFARLVVRPRGQRVRRRLPHGVAGRIALLPEPDQRRPGQGAPLPAPHDGAVRGRRPGARARARPHQGRPPPARDPVGGGPGAALRRSWRCTSASRRPRACSSTRSRSACSSWPRAIRSPRARSCPPLVNDDAELVNANSRLALVSVDRRARSAGCPRPRCPAALRRRLVAALRARSSSWSRRSSRSRSRARVARRPTTSGSRQLERGGDAHAEHPARRRARWRCSAASVGFLAFFAAFSLKDDLVALGVVLVASVRRQLRRRDRRRRCCDARCARR